MKFPMMRCSIYGVLLLALSCVSVSSAAETLLGKKLESLQLKDYRGRDYSLSDFKDQKLIVVAFLGTECPLATMYGPRLAQLAGRFESRGAAFVGVNANSQDSLTEIAAYARTHKIEFPILKDVTHELTSKLGAERTPEVFVLDAQRVVRYHGRIDDQYGVGYINDKPKRQDLALALDELLADKPVSKASTPAVGCLIGRRQPPQSNARVTYSHDIAPLLQQHCVECHRAGDIAPFALTDFEEVAGWGAMLVEVTRENRMPPWHADPKHGKFSNARGLDETQKQLLVDWVAAGAPEGDRAELSKPREFVSGWQLPKAPDQVIPIHKTPYKVQAQGRVSYQYFKADFDFKEDKWLAAAELQPGNRAVVHHILAFARPAGSPAGIGGGGVTGFLVSYVPGMRAAAFPSGMAKRIPAGSELVFQVHYTPTGTEQFDDSRLGLVFADPKTLTHEVRTMSAANPTIRIPANADNHREQAVTQQSLPGSLLIACMPHMHLRGKSFQYEAQFPDGKTEVLLDIPHYDFNWQTSYHFAEPQPIPAGTTIKCVAHYDNSEHNLANPDPSKLVRWGDQTWEEMLIGYFDIAVPMSADSEKAAPKPASKPKPKAAPNAAAGLGALLLGNAAPAVKAKSLITRFDTNKDGQIGRTEVPDNLHRIFDVLDTNKDGSLPLDELTESIKKVPK